MDKSERMQEMFARGPVGVWVNILGPKASKIILFFGSVGLILYLGFWIFSGFQN